MPCGSAIIGISSWSCPITITEIYAGMRPHEEKPTRAFMRSLLFFGITQEIAEQAGLLKAQYSKRGKAISFQDASIAAVCIAHGCSLVTENTSDFPISGRTGRNPSQRTPPRSSSGGSNPGPLPRWTNCPRAGAGEANRYPPTHPKLAFVTLPLTEYVYGLSDNVPVFNAFGTDDLDIRILIRRITSGTRGVSPVGDARALQNTARGTWRTKDAATRVTVTVDCTSAINTIQEAGLTKKCPDCTSALARIYPVLLAKSDPPRPRERAVWRGATPCFGARQMLWEARRRRPGRLDRSQHTRPPVESEHVTRPWRG